MRTAILALLCLLVAGSGLVAAPAAGSQAPPGLVPMHVKNVLLVNDLPAVLLVDGPQQRYLLLYVDFNMAAAIRAGMDGPPPQRPLTHDLLCTLVRRLGGAFTRVTLTRLKDHTYYALLSVKINASGAVEDFDTRPSDALAIAVRSHTPIYAAAKLLRPLGEGLGIPGEPPPGEPAPETQAAPHGQA